MKRSQLSVIAFAIVFLVVGSYRWLRDLSSKDAVHHPAPRVEAPVTTAPPAPAREPRNDATGIDSITEAFRMERSKVWVEGSGVVEAVLRDDNEGARHQKFIVRLSKEQTVLISHNIDIARRVPVDKGDEVSFRGEYIWNTKGGIVHWTHHDPGGRRAGGWIRIGSSRYD